MPSHAETLRAALTATNGFRKLAGKKTTGQLRDSAQRVTAATDRQKSKNAQVRALREMPKR